MANTNNGNLSSNNAREISNSDIAPTKKVSTFISNLRPNWSKNPLKPVGPN